MRAGERNDSLLAGVFLAGLVALVGVLAALQFHWLGEISRAERVRMRSWLEAAAGRFGLELDREVARLLVAMAGVPPPGEDLEAVLAERLASFRAEATWPGLARDLVRFALAPDGSLRWERLDEASGELVALDWPEGRAAFEERVRLHSSHLAHAMPEAEGPPALFDGQLGAVMLPMLHRRLPSGPPGRRGSEPPDREPLIGYLVRLDLAVLTTEVLPQLGRRHLVGEDGAYGFAVLREDGSEVYRQGNRPAGGGDVSVALFGLPPPEELHGLLGPGEWMRERRRPSLERAGPREPVGPRGWWSMLSRAGAPVWRLSVWHPRGSLEVAVERLRRRNLAVGLGIHLLLAGAGGMLLLTVRRAQALARERLRLVSAITHELRTPLAGMRSLGENLADGIVTRPEQVRLYGERIEREGSRLSQLVEQALALSGLLARGRRAPRVAVEVDRVIADAVGDCGPLAAESGAAVRVEADGAPAVVVGDPESLRRAVGNLVQNAIRHGGGEVVVRRQVGGRWCELVVSDRGPGIPAAELERVFEPFFRGQRAVDGQVAGSGLGLALVREIAEAHGGRVEVASRPGEGSSFRLLLPLAAEPGRPRVDGGEADR